MKFIYAPVQRGMNSRCRAGQWSCTMLFKPCTILNNARALTVMGFFSTIILELDQIVNRQATLCKQVHYAGAMHAN